MGTLCGGDGERFRNMRMTRVVRGETRVVAVSDACVCVGSVSPRSAAVPRAILPEQKFERHGAQMQYRKVNFRSANTIVFRMAAVVARAARPTRWRAAIALKGMYEENDGAPDMSGAGCVTRDMRSDHIQID